MGGETEAQVSGWTVDTLASYLQRQIDDAMRLLDERQVGNEKNLQTALTAADKAVQAALLSAKEAVIKAELASEKRFDAVNEFRQLVTDLVRECMPRIEADQRIRTLDEKITELKETVAASAGKSTGMNVLWGYILGAAGVIVAIVSIATH